MQDKIDGVKLKLMFLSATQYLENNKKIVNELNVFPVPDGDTGTNMSLTMLSAAKEIKALNVVDITQVADALSRGSLKGARGNSGVILSQLFRGFSKSLKGENSISTVKYAEALKAGVDTAYKAVMKPVEGTILTVARVTAEEARNIANQTKDFTEFFKKIIEVAKNTLDKTPDLLPVLKQAGVVDSGGMGLLYIMIGCEQALREDFDLDMPTEDFADYSSGSNISMIYDESIEFAYCTEFFIKNLHPHVQESDIEKLKDKLEKLGDSIVVVGDDELVKVHFHTNMPGKALQLALRLGELSSIKIDNMREQHQHVIEMKPQQPPKEPPQNFGVLSVAMGNGVASIFKDLSADYIIEGGQTMNPSIEDILTAAAKVNANQLFVLPNNSNIVLSANQAAQISDKPLHVIPTKSIPQGMAAMIAYNPDVDVHTNITAMTEAIQQVKTGQITFAVRNSQIDDLIIHEGDIMGIMDGQIVAVGKELVQVTKELLDKMLEEDGEIVTLLYGSDAKEEQTKDITAYLSDSYSQVDVEVLSGGQPLYYYIISVE